MIKYGGKIDCCLHEAVKRHNLEAVKFLVQNGANIFKKNEKFEVPFDLAIEG